MTAIDTAIDAVREVGHDTLTNMTGYDVGNITNMLEDIRPAMANITDTLIAFVQRLACRPLYDVYYTVTHEAACTNSYTGTVWIFVSLLFMSCFGLLAITFRAALYPVVANDLELDSEEEKESEKEMGLVQSLEKQPELCLNATDRTHENNCEDSS